MWRALFYERLRVSESLHYRMMRALAIVVLLAVIASWILETLWHVLDSRRG